MKIKARIIISVELESEMVQDATQLLESFIEEVHYEFLNTSTIQINENEIQDYELVREIN